MGWNPPAAAIVSSRFVPPPYDVVNTIKEVADVTVNASSMTCASSVSVPVFVTLLDRTPRLVVDIEAAFAPWLPKATNKAADARLSLLPYLIIYFPPKCSYNCFHRGYG